MVSRILRRSGVAVLQIAEYLKWRPSLVVQVGVGQFHEETDVMQDAWPGVRFVGFEPCLKIYDMVQEHYPGPLHRMAVGAAPGTAVLHVKERHKDGSSLFPPNREGERCSEETVVVTTLDEICLHEIAHKHILLWLDCEGSELAALQGAEQFVKRVEVVNVETASKPPGGGWCSPIDLHDWLAGHGFWRLWTHTYRDCAGQCDCIYVRTGLFDPRYCICPCELRRWRERKGAVKQ